MTPSVAVVTPVWRPTLGDDELVRMQLTLRSTPRWPHIALHPRGLETDQLTSLLPNWTFQSCADTHLSSVRSYSSWLLQQDFYDQFTEFDFIIIAQLDSVLLNEPPEQAFGYDYLGAPWDPPWRVIVAAGQMRIVKFLGRTWGRQLVVGNGGLSIRHTEHFRVAARELATFADQRVLESANEDAVWSYYAQRLGLSVAPIDIASTFLDLRADQSCESGSWAGIHGLRRETQRANSFVREFFADGA